MYGAGGKVFRAPGRGGQRQLDYGVRTGGQRHARAAVFVSDGRKTALHEIAAHHDKDGVSAGKAARFVHMILMAAVEWVIFCNKAGYFQGKAPF